LSNDSKIGVPIEQWNHSKLTLKLIEQLIQFKPALEIVITDNGSQPVELALLKKGINQIKQQQVPETLGVTILENRYNSGFSVGTNLSISKLLETNCEWIWLLNNDIDTKGFDFNVLKNKLSKLPPSIIGMSMSEGGGELFSGSYRFDRWWSTFSEIDNISSAKKIKQKHRYISGANMIVHRSIFQKVGLLNSRTFLYFEELDFTRRAKSFGYEQVLIDSVYVNHLGSASSNENSFSKKRMYHQTWSTLDYYFTHEKILFLPCLVIRTCARQITLLLSGRKHLIGAVFSATFDFLLGKNLDRQTPDIISEHKY